MISEEVRKALDLCEGMLMRYEQCEPDVKHGCARTAVIAGFELLAAVLGPQVIADALGAAPAPDAPRKEKLQALAQRLLVASFLEPSGVEEGSISQAYEEVRAIAHGDAATLFAEFPRTKGRPTNAFRLARHQLRAQEWYVHLRHVGNSSAVAQLAVQDAFGASWDAIKRWDVQASRELGEAYVQKALDRAADARWIDAGMWKTPEQAAERLKRDGLAYLQELRRRGSEGQG